MRANIRFFNYKKLNYGFIFFNIGVVFLFSAPAVSLLFLIPSIYISFLLKGTNPKDDSLNIFFVITIILMLLSCLYTGLTNSSINLEKSFIENTNPFYSLFNWIPLFICYWGFNPYLKTKKHREFFSISIIFSTMPLIVSGLGQYLIDWHGPFELFNGLIIWYQRSISSGGLTSVFNNQNYAGCIFATVLPFFIFSFSKKNSKLENSISVIFSFLVITSIIFTESRNAFLSLILMSFLIMPNKLRLIFAGFISFLIAISTFIFKSYDFIYLYDFRPEVLINDQRVLIWRESLKYIFEKPFLGWGGHGFSSIWNSTIRYIPLKLENVKYYGHAHNLPLEITINYGILTSILISGIIIFILVKSWKRIYPKISTNYRNHNEESRFEKAWFISSLLILIFHLFDIVYYDIRVSILFWILMAGLRNISFGNHESNEISNGF